MKKINQKQISNRTDASVRRYLEETKVKNSTPLTREQELNLSLLIKSGDKRALNTLVEANLLYAVSYAKEFQTGQIDLAELLAQANIGLIKAAQKFDGERGFKFITYAKVWIRQSILEYIGEYSRKIRVPANVSALLTKISKYKEIHYQNHGRYPQSHEIAEAIDVKLSNVILVTEQLDTVVSMDNKLSIEGSSGTLQDKIKNNDSISPEQGSMEDSHTILINQITKHLKYRDRTVIEMIFGINGYTEHTMSDVGEKFDLTKERVRQIKMDALSSMRKAIKRNNIETY